MQPSRPSVQPKWKHFPWGKAISRAALLLGRFYRKGSSPNDTLSLQIGKHISLPNNPPVLHLDNPMGIFRKALVMRHNEQGLVEFLAELLE